MRSKAVTSTSQPANQLPTTVPALDSRQVLMLGRWLTSSVLAPWLSRSCIVTREAISPRKAACPSSAVSLLHSLCFRPLLCSGLLWYVIGRLLYVEMTFVIAPMYHKHLAYLAYLAFIPPPPTSTPPCMTPPHYEYVQHL